MFLNTQVYESFVFRDILSQEIVRIRQLVYHLPSIVRKTEILSINLSQAQKDYRLQKDKRENLIRSLKISREEKQRKLQNLKKQMQVVIEYLKSNFWGIKELRSKIKLLEKESNSFNFSKELEEKEMQCKKIENQKRTLQKKLDLKLFQKCQKQLQRQKEINKCNSVIKERNQAMKIIQKSKETKNQLRTSEKQKATFLGEYHKNYENLGVEVQSYRQKNGELEKIRRQMYLQNKKMKQSFLQFSIKSSEMRKRNVEIYQQNNKCSERVSELKNHCSSLNSQIVVFKAKRESQKRENRKIENKRESLNIVLLKLFQIKNKLLNFSVLKENLRSNENGNREYLKEKVYC